jgi:hypothetical protein
LSFDGGDDRSGAECQQVPLLNCKMHFLLLFLLWKKEEILFLEFVFL